VNAVDFNSDDSILASCSYDASVRLWDCKFTAFLGNCLTARSQNRMPIQVLEDAKDSVTSIQIKNYEIITGSVDGRLRTYDLRVGKLMTDVIARMSCHSSPLTN
jgi:mitogen-activated protein kinase organizer 1